MVTIIAKLEQDSIVLAIFNKLISLKQMILNNDSHVRLMF